MKKTTVIVLALAAAAAMSACGGAAQDTAASPSDVVPAVEEPATSSELRPADLPAPTASPEPSTEPEAPEETASVPEPEAPGEGTMSYAEFLAAPVGSAVTVDAWVQAKQEWWDYKLTVYAQSEDGAYFINNMGCTRAEAEALTEGSGLRVSGVKYEWAGGTEIADAAFEPIEGEYLAPAEDVTGLLGGGALIERQNARVLFRGLRIEEADENGGSFRYGEDGEGVEGSDLFFRASSEEGTFEFVVPRGLSAPGEALYEAVRALHVGDRVDLEGFLFWHDGPLPHVTSVEIIQ